MNVVAQKNGRSSQDGVALIIAIFTLLLISVIATSLILMAGTTTAIKANYKTSMQAFYDAKAGLEEGRSRLSAAHPDTVKACAFPRLDQPMPLDRVCYIINPDTASGETVDPTDPSSPYADTEYAQEFGRAPATVQMVNSNSAATTPGIGGPLYKWVRINPVTERSMGVSVSGSGTLDFVNPLFISSLDGHQYLWRNSPLLPTNLSSQVLAITALAVLPSGGSSGRRLLQYTINQNPNALAQSFAPNASPPLTINELRSLFPAVVTMVGPDPARSWFDAANSGSFSIEGTDRRGSEPGACNLPTQSPVAAIGVTGDPTKIVNSIPPPRVNSYRGAGGYPSINDITSDFKANEGSVSDLESLVDRLAGVATEVVQGPAAGLPIYGSITSPVIAVVRGTSGCPTCAADLTLSGSVKGYGILVVTGELTIKDVAGWRGIVLVIGKGIINGDDALIGSELDGTLVVAATRDSSGTLLPSLGAPRVDWSRGTSNGLYYDTCWITNMSAAFPYHVLSFREIPQQP